MRRVICLMCLSLFLCAAPARDGLAVVAVQPPRGTFQMRPDLQGRHPRLFFSAEDLPELRRRATAEASFYVTEARSDFRSYLGQPMPDPPESWKKYLYGNWALVAFDLLAVAKDDASAAATAKDWALALSEATWWKVDDLAPMDALAGMATTYDILYDRFTEAERQQLRAAIYDGMTFIAQRFFVGQYWTYDYQNNHMHNRLHALATAAFAIYGDDPALDVQPQADLAIRQIENLIAWLPEDGSQHEGPGYWSFGHHWVAKIVHLAEHVTGRDLSSTNSHMQTAHLFRIYMTAPGWDHTLNIGDGGDGELSDVTPLVRGAAEAADGSGATLVEQFMATDPGRFYRYTIWGLLWEDPMLEPRPIDEWPLGRFWPDLEMFSIRSGWDDDAVAFVFKCGPVGGHKMQRLRGDEYINVAHDHPDQNHFLLFAYGKMLAADDGYPKEHKLTANHNSIIIDGQGQPREGGGWMQPFDYALTGTMNDRFLAGATAFATGDAGPCYEEADRFLRHAFFVDGRYVVLFDDLVGSGGVSREYQWRLHNDGDWRMNAWDHFTCTEDDVSLDIRFLNDGPMTSEFLPAVETAEPCLAVTKTGATGRFLSVLTPRKGAMAPPASQRLEGYNAVAVQVDVDGRQDVVVVADPVTGPGWPDVFVAGDVFGRAVAAVAGRAGDRLEEAMVVRGDWLAVDSKQVFGASADVNFAWRRDGDGAVVEVAPPYKRNAPGAVELTVGGLQAGGGYLVDVDGEASVFAAADGEGAVMVDVDVSAARTLHIQPAAAGDANGDGRVDIADFIVLKNNFGAADAAWTDGDFNGDGRVDISDFIILKNNFGA